MLDPSDLEPRFPAPLRCHATAVDTVPVSHLLAQVIPLALAAAVSPVILIGSVAILGGARPIARCAVFTLGAAIVTVGVAAGGLLLVELTHDTGGAGHGGPLGSPAARLIVGALLLAAAVWLFTSRPDPAKQERSAARLADPATPLTGFFAMGLGLMITNVTTIALLLAIIHQVARADAGLTEEVVALVVACVIILLPALVPLGAAAFGGSRARDRLGRLGTLATRYSRPVVGVLLVAFGIQHVVEGITAL